MSAIDDAMEIVTEAFPHLARVMPTCGARPIREQVVEDAVAAAGLKFDALAPWDMVVEEHRRLRFEYEVQLDDEALVEAAIYRVLSRSKADVMTEDQFGALMTYYSLLVARCRASRGKRRAKLEMIAIRGALFWLAWWLRPATVRQLYYQAVSHRLIDKTEQEYKGVVCRLLADLRRERALPFKFLADNTRWMRKSTTYDSLQDAVESVAYFYRRDIWNDQERRVEVWLEKEALAGVVMQATDPWHVPLMVTRGYPSLSFVHSAAEVIASHDVPTIIYYLGDHDPSGKDIPRFVEETLGELAPGADITFDLLAVQPHHIEELNLPTRPTKKSDSRAKNFKGESVEVDAINPRLLCRMVEDSITQHIDDDRLQRLQVAEAAERQTLDDFAQQLTA